MEYISKLINSLTWGITYLWPFIIVIVILVVVHELGHYWVARKNGVKVECFSIGIGPELWGVTDKHGTRWRLSVFPLGGYVRFAHDTDITSSRPSKEIMQSPPEDSLMAKTVNQRIAVSAAGPIANYLFAFIILTFLYATMGVRHTAPIIDKVVSESPAAMAGLHPGDNIVAVDELPVNKFEKIVQIINEAKNKKAEGVTLKVLRGEEVLLFKVPFEIKNKEEDKDKKRYGIGIVSRTYEYTPTSFDKALVEALGTCIKVSVESFKAISRFVLNPFNNQEVGGTIRIADMSYKVANSGDTYWFLQFLALLSINLGFFNFLPVPMLDGGHIFYYLIEKATGKPVDEKWQEYGFWLGFGLLISLFLISTWSDLQHVGVIKFIKNLLG